VRPEQESRLRLQAIVAAEDLRALLRAYDALGTELAAAYTMRNDFAVVAQNNKIIAEQWQARVKELESRFRSANDTEGKQL
jgi:hypothetical protein